MLSHKLLMFRKTSSYSIYLFSLQNFPKMTNRHSIIAKKTPQLPNFSTKKVVDKSLTQLKKNSSPYIYVDNFYYYSYPPSSLYLLTSAIRSLRIVPLAESPIAIYSPKS